MILRISGRNFTLGRGGEWKLTPRPGGWLIAESPDGRRIRLAGLESAGKLGFSIGGSLFSGELKEERSPHGGASAPAGDTDLSAQFPGKVRKVLVAAGARVEAGAPLVLIEAMKMEFTVKAPASGVVRKILVAEGQQLSPGDRLLEIDEGADGG